MQGYEIWIKNRLFYYKVIFTNWTNNLEISILQYDEVFVSKGKKSPLFLDLSPLLSIAAQFLNNGDELLNCCVGISTIVSDITSVKFPGF